MGSSIFSQRKRFRNSKKISRQRQLGLEALESRQLLAVTDPFTGDSPAFDTAAPEPTEFELGNYGISEKTGAATYNYPIPVPPGRHAMQPSLDMSYSSRASLRGNRIAAGWELNFPSIERDTSTGIRGEKHFMATLGGATGRLVETPDVAMKGGTTFRVENDDAFTIFERYTRPDDEIPDRTFQMAAFSPGDADLNGVFDRYDLIQVLRANEYQDGVPFNSTWAEGDWNGDRDFNRRDLILALQTANYEQGRFEAQAVSRNSVSGTINVSGTTIGSGIVLGGDDEEAVVQPTDPDADSTDHTAWLARTTDGKTHFFGSTRHSSDGSTRWYLDKQVDRAGNTILYNWSEVRDASSDVVDYAIDSIEYTLNADADLAAHAHGIIHRDIKPSNLIMDTGGVVWVTDFGLAKTDDAGMTHTGDILGTMRYMSPERFQGKCDGRADLYALGLTLFELLLLRPAFPSRDRLKLIEMIRDCDPPAPRSVDPRIPRDLETIVLKAIHKDPARRYQSAAGLAEELGCFLDDRPIRSRPATARERAWRACRRNPVISILTASVLSLAMLFVSGVFVAALRLNDSNDQLQFQLGRAQKAERISRVRLVDSLYNEARAWRHAGQVGQTFEAVRAIRESLRVLDQLDIGPEERANRTKRLRNEALAAMSLVDVRRRWSVDRSSDPMGAVSHSLGLFTKPRRQGAIAVHRVGVSEAEFVLPGIGLTPGRQFFDATGRWLVVRYGRDDEMALVVWDLEQRREQWRVSEPFIRGLAYDSHSQRVAFLADRKPLRICDLTTGDVLDEVDLPDNGNRLAFDPKDLRLAVSFRGRKRCGILDLENGKWHWWNPPTIITGLSFSPRDRLLAGAGHNGSVYLWNGDQPDVPVKVLEGHRVHVEKVHFDPTGKMLLSSSWDQTVRFWDPLTGRCLLTAAGDLTSHWNMVSPDSQRVVVDLGSRMACRISSVIIAARPFAAPWDELRSPLRGFLGNPPFA